LFFLASFRTLKEENNAKVKKYYSRKSKEALEKKKKIKRLRGNFDSKERSYVPSY